MAKSTKAGSTGRKTGKKIRKSKRDGDRLLALWQQMALIRRFEERCG